MTYYQPPKPPKPPTSGWAVWSMILGIFGLLFGCCTFGIFSLLAIILGHVALPETRDGRKTGHGMAKAGLIMGYLFFVPALAFSIVTIAQGALGGLLMAVTIAIKCDAPACDTTAEVASPTAFPKVWKVIDVKQPNRSWPFGSQPRTFCSWVCIGDWANALEATNGEMPKASIT